MAISYSTIFKRIGQLVAIYNDEYLPNQTGARSAAVSAVRSYFTDVLPMETDVDSTYRGFDDNWDYLKSLMEDDSETLNANSVSATGVSADASNTGNGDILDLSGTPASGAVTATQMLKDGDVFRIVYQGNSKWTVHSKLRGQISEQATSDVQYDGDTCGIGFKMVTGGTAWAVGDTFYVDTCTSDDGGAFITFFRDAIGKADLPVDTGGTETISDSLAT